LPSRFLDRVEDRNAFVHGSTFAGSDSGHNLSPILHGLKRMKAAFPARDALNDEPRILIDEYAH
jgi:hypothetical protein